MSKIEWTAYEETFRIRSQETAEDGRLTVVSLVRLMQEAAHRHTLELGVSLHELQVEKKAWVLLRQRIEWSDLPKMDETLHIKTYPSSIDRLYTQRDFYAIDATGQEVATAATTWMLFDTQRRRPTRLPRLISDIEFPSGLPVLSKPKLPDAISELTDTGVSYHIGYHDVDYVGHLTNTKHLEWLMEGYCKRGGSMLEGEVTVAYEAEARQGDVVRLSTGAGGATLYNAQDKVVSRMSWSE